jgi:hypothetical protein
MPTATVRRLSRASTTGVAVLLAFGLAATGSSSAAPVSSGATSRLANTSAGELTPTALVRHVAFVDSDFTDGTTVHLVPGGNKVRGRVTLDNCGFTFGTEKRRVARHQTRLVPAEARNYFVSNEVVAYETPHYAAKALRQLRTSVTECRKHVFMPSGLAGVPDIRYDVSKVRTSLILPVSDNAVVIERVTFRGAGHAWGVFIFQRRGTVLSAVYLQQRKRPSAAKVALARSLARITGDRLAAI